MLNADGAVHYQRENDQTWAETEQRFPQLNGLPPAFYYQTPGPRFWSTRASTASTSTVTSTRTSTTSRSLTTCPASAASAA